MQAAFLTTVINLSSLIPVAQWSFKLINIFETKSLIGTLQSNNGSENAYTNDLLSKVEVYHNYGFSW